MQGRMIVALTATILLVGLVTAGAGVQAQGPRAEPSHFRESVFEGTIQRHVTLRYLLYLPRDYDRPGVLWPMIVYLHGGLGRGNDFQKMSWYPLPRLLRETGRDLPFVVLMPQCPEAEIWDSDELLALVDQVSASLSVDQDRIFLVGYSMGGTGAWRLALAHPERFAALAPMSGYADPARAARQGDPDLGFPRSQGQARSPRRVRTDGQGTQGRGCLCAFLTRSRARPCSSER